MPVPLTNARTTGIGKDDSTSFLESIDETVTSNGGANLLRSWRNSEPALEVKAVISSLLDDGSRASHILVGRVGARTDETNFDFLGPAILLDFLSEFGDRGSQIGCEGTVDMRLKFREVLKITLKQPRRYSSSKTYDLNVLIVFSALVGLQVVSESLSILSNLGTLSSLEIVRHAIVEGEEGGGSTDFSAHVTNSSHTRARERL